MVSVRNKDIELLLEINEELNDPRLEELLDRWIKGRDENRKIVREIIAERRKIDKNYARGKKKCVKET